MKSKNTIKGRKALKKKAEKLLHLYVRKRSVGLRGFGICYTCYRPKSFEELEAGHRYHGKLDLDIRNLKIQCTRCNRFLHGNLGEYERHLLEDYGKEWCDQLKKDSDDESKCNYSYEFLIEFIEKFKKLLAEL